MHPAPSSGSSPASPTGLKLAPLAAVEHRVVLGAPLPFNVRNADETLLLARGQQVANAEQLEALMIRGALVDLNELRSARDEALMADRRELPRLWQRTLSTIADTLVESPAEHFAEALDDAAAPALALVERDPDLAIFQVLSGATRLDTRYGVRRSLHSAITASLVAQRLCWQPRETERAFKAALTMNLSMLELQGVLARQTEPPTEAQRAELASHPMRSVQMLQRAGVNDADWLRAVLQHHEVEDGSGYPSGRRDVDELAGLLRRADVYTSKLAARQTRDALAADVAGRAIFMADPGHPMTQAIVKEFGIYPPGCHVRLASGAVGVVVGRGPTVTTPVVARLSDEHGRPLPTPERVATGSHPSCAVAGLVPLREGLASVGDVGIEALLALA